VIDHAELRAVLGAYLARFALGKDAAAHAAVDVGRPDQGRPLHPGVVARRPGLGRVERLVRVELVHEQEEALVVRRLLFEPTRGGRHGAGPGKVCLAPEPAARVVVVRVAAPEARRARPARIGPRAPGVALVTALVAPGAEVG